MSEAASLIERARKYLGSAELLLKAGDFESSASRSYYAMFYAAEALLLSKGLAFSSHKGVLSGFGLHFVKPDILPAELGRDLKRAFSKRQLGDYEYTFSVSESDAEQLPASGHQFVTAAVAYLTQHGFLD